MKKKIPILEKIRKETPLKTRLFISLQMEDYDNWENGDYNGDIKKLIKLTEWILEDVYKWIDDGMPGKDD